MKRIFKAIVGLVMFGIIALYFAYSIGTLILIFTN